AVFCAVSLFATEKEGSKSSNKSERSTTQRGVKSVRNLDLKNINSFTKEQIQAIPITAENVKLLTPKAMEQLSKDQIIEIGIIGGSNNSLVKLLTREQINGLWINQISSLDERFIQRMTVEQIRWLTPGQINFLSHSQLPYFEWHGLPFTPEQLKCFTPRMIEMLTPKQWRLITLEQALVLTKNQLQFLTEKVINEQINPYVLKTAPESWINNLPHKVNIRATSTSATQPPVPTSVTQSPAPSSTTTTASTASGSSLVSKGKTATSSSNENNFNYAGNAVDGNPSTRWASAASDPQWLQVDLGKNYTITKVVLNWEAAYAAAYKIQISSNGST
ncbi:MAG TPA: discoidin domain-containing protein, partial [bacterium]|nr:discoidin domain-containing protein [bacterium]